MTHVLKTEHKWFVLAKHGYKNVEIRNNDRGFKADDTVVLADWKDVDGEWKYTGETIVKKIDWVYDDVPGVKDGYVLIVFNDSLSDEELIQAHKEFSSILLRGKI